jgi:hypothetical protein
MTGYIMDWNALIQIALGVVLSVGAYLYNDLKKSTDDVKVSAAKTAQDLVDHKLKSSEKFVTSDHLAQAVGNINKTLETVAASMVRVEQRLNNQIDNSNARNNNT